MALVVRDVLPSGEVRVSSVRRHLPSNGKGVELGLEAFVYEEGEHNLLVMVYAVGKSGEDEGVLFETHRVVTVTNPPPVIADDGLVLYGVDMEEAVERWKKQHDTQKIELRLHMQRHGVPAPLTPLAAVLAENDGLVLCGVDTPATVQGSMRAIVAGNRESPSSLCLIARDTLPGGSKPADMVRKVLVGTAAQTIGIEVRMGEAGEDWVEFSVAECTDQGLVEVFFIPTSRVCVSVPEGLDYAEEAEENFSEPELVEQEEEAEENFSEPELVEQEEEAEAELVTAPAVAEKTVRLKVGFYSDGPKTEDLVIRRLSLAVGVDTIGRYVEPLKTVMEALTRTFKSELLFDYVYDSHLEAVRVRSWDEVGELVEVRSDQDMCAALCAPAKGGVVRLSLWQ